MTEYFSDFVQINNLSGVLKVVTGDSFSCALIDDGTVKCWGKNNFMQIAS